MIRKSFCSTLLVLVCLVASAANAKTFRYELDDLFSIGAGFNYPGLELSGATAATLILEQDSPQSPATISSITVEFPFASTLTIRNFREIAPFVYTAKVNNMWVFRELNVIVNFFNAQTPEFQPLVVDVFVSEGENFLNDNQPPQPNPGQHLLNILGTPREVTPSQVVDTESLIVDGKRLKLSLRNSLAFNPQAFTHQFLINSVWFGNGEEDLVIQSGFPPEIARFLKPFRLEVTEQPGPTGIDYLINIFFKDENNNELQTGPLLLRDLLNQAYPASQP